MEPKVKTLEDFKKDKADLERQFEQAKQQTAMVLGAKLYVEQEIVKLEKPEESKVEEVKS